ncbi:MAG: hypothetical protein KC549_03105, partial [Myxococcales bacterium]|nr:hypothetical protein [Myxococcales bacterium]
SFYPHYLQQGRDVDGAPPQEGGKPVWSTYMDRKLKARGWKRYLVQPRANRRPLMPDTARDEHKSRFAPLPAGTRFVARVRVHNLRPMELGALIWALDFGGHAGAMHQIGRGRPLGFGAVTLRRTAEALRTVVGGEAVAAADTVEAFTGYMQAATGEKWASSRTLFELLAMVTPVDERESREIGYPRIQPNDFNKIKQDGAALLPWGGRAKWEAWKKERPAGARRADRAWTGDLLPQPPAPEEEIVDVAETATPGQAAAAAPQKGSPREAEAAPPWAGWVEVVFLDFNGARETRKLWAKKKEKERRVRVRAVDGRGEGELSTTRTAGIGELFGALASANAAFTFFARVDDEAIAQVALALPPEATG